MLAIQHLAHRYPKAAGAALSDVSLQAQRGEVLGMLGPNGPQAFPHITRRIRYANDIQALWYLRGDMMGALSTMHGEVKARENMSSITHMFEGLLPGGLSSRPSPLMG